MHMLQQLNKEEYQVANRVERYFKSNDMSFQDKVYNAMLIAQYELEGHHYSSDEERTKIARFKTVLDRLLQKISPDHDLSIAPTAQNGISEE